MALTQTTLGARLRKARENCGMTQEEAAAAIGMPRTSLLQIEAGNRAVSSLELVQLSRLYHRDIGRLVSEGDDTEEETPLVTLCRVLPQLAKQSQVREEIAYYLDLFEEGIELSRLLGSKPRTLLPQYDLPEPSSHAEAARQGEWVAVEERRRLNLGICAVADAAALLGSQGVWAAAVRLPDELSGLFLFNERLGMAILINQSHGSERQRFSYAHEYAHALIDRTRHPESFTGRQNAGDFIEKRANAFAGAFLMPADGVCELLNRLNKGGASREAHWLWDVATEKGEHFERRNEPGSQDIGYQDVAYLSHHFAVSYDTAVYRLTDMKFINRQEQAGLLEFKSRGLELMGLLEFQEPEPSAPNEVERPKQPLLIREIGRLAVEAFRRGAISGGRFLEVCEKLRIRDAEKLLQLARNAQE